MKDKSAKMAADLDRVVTGDVYGDILHRAAYSCDASIYRIVPSCVVLPRGGSDVAAVVKYAAAEGIAVAARGAGSGVAGESLCSGIVIDTARYMKRIIGAEDGGVVVECEPGVVLGDLNAYLAGFGRKIGPDPSSGNRAVVGGCVANNATGAHSLEYGYMADYVQGVEAVLGDGSIVEFGNGIEGVAAGQGRAGAITRSCFSLLSENQDIIARSMPRCRRNRSGYNIAGVCRGGKIDMARLLAGSEGTLAIFTRIRLRTVPVAAAKGLLQLEFDSAEKMAQAVDLIVESGASACELTDRGLIETTLAAYPEYGSILPAGAEMVLLVEHTGQSEDQVREKIDKTDSAVGEIASGRRVVFDSRQQERLWKSRKDAVPLLYRKRGGGVGGKPVAFIEDVSVDHRRLGEYISGLRRIGSKHEIELSFYGHAGDGELHIRPWLDLSSSSDVEKMRAIAEEVFSLAWSLGGSISGEHADGLVRAAFVERQYGKEFYGLLGLIKGVFDPAGIMNPGKILNSDPDIMVRNLRAKAAYLDERLESSLLLEADELRGELEGCNGCGVCLSSEQSQRMCPVFRAVGEEMGSSRAKANLLRFRATGGIEDGCFESDEFRVILDLCINCKACSLECPSGVDVSKLMLAARTEYVKRKGLRRAEGLLSRNRYLSKAGSIFSPLSNFVMSLGVSGWFLEKIVGLEARRKLPRFESGSFLHRGRRFLACAGPVEKPIDRVAYFVDTYANYNDHGLGFAVIECLRYNNIEVILPDQLPAPLPAICYGDVKSAKKDMSFNVRHLAEAVRAGYKIICSEPSAALCLKEDLRLFVSGSDAELVSANTYELMSYLLGLLTHGKLKHAENPAGGEFLYHLPCHLLAAGGDGASIEILHEICGAEVTQLGAGCCGMAGTFGMQKKNYELSLKMAQGLKESLASSPAGVVLTECGGCRMQIEHISGRVVRHPIEVISRAYGYRE